MFSILALTLSGLLFCLAGLLFGATLGGFFLGDLTGILESSYDVLLTVASNAIALAGLWVLWRNARLESPINADDSRLNPISLLFFGLPLNRRVLFAAGAVLWACSLFLGIVLAFNFH